MKNICTICLLLATASWLGAQCNPDLVPPFLQPKNNTVLNLGGPKCTAVVKAEQLLQAYSDNCTPASNLTLRLRRIGTSTGFPFLPSNTLTLSPADLGNPIFVELWARDAAGNTAYVYAGLTVQNPGGCSFALLPDTLNAQVGLLNNRLEDISWEMEIVSPLGSSYYFHQDWLPLPEDLFSGPAQDDIVTIRPGKDNDPLNGVTTYDLVLISKGILGLEPFSNPYKYLAADADRNNRVTVGDLAELRKLILGIYTELPNSDSWRFVPADYFFPMPENAFYEQIPESVTFDRHRLRPLPDFVALKVGNVDFNAITNSLLEVEDRGSARLDIPDMKLTQGQTVLVPVFLTDIPDLFGLQCAFGFDASKIEITGVQAAALADFSADNIYQPEPGLLTLSWAKLEPAQIDIREPLFFLEIKALQNGRLRDMLHLKPARLVAEAYPQSGGIAALELTFRDLPKPIADEISPAYPNPASEGFSIPVQLAEGGRVALELFGSDGRRVFALDQQLEAGEHLLKAPQLAAGLYVYRVSAGTAFLEGKVVLR